MLTLRYYSVKMSLLVHTCCADCLLHLVEAQKKDIKIVVYFDNPNIHPRSEMLSRLGAVKKVAAELGIKKVVVADWEPGLYFKAIGKNKEFGKRCVGCWELRLSRLVSQANKMGIKKITTTMLSSSYLNRKKIVELGEGLARENGLELVVPKITTHECRHIGFYKQNYCGCVYSLKERLEEKHAIPESRQDLRRR